MCSHNKSRRNIPSHQDKQARYRLSNPPPEIPADPLQPGKIQLHPWQLYIPEAPVLDLRGKKVTSTLDLVDAFQELCLCSTDSDQQEESSPNGRRKR